MNAALAVAYLHLIAFLSNAMLFLQYKYSRSAMDAFIVSTPTKCSRMSLGLANLAITYLNCGRLQHICGTLNLFPE